MKPILNRLVSWEYKSNTDREWAETRGKSSASGFSLCTSVKAIVHLSQEAWKSEVVYVHLVPQLATRNTTKPGPLGNGVTGRAPLPLDHWKVIERPRPQVPSLGRETTVCKDCTVRSFHSWEPGQEGKGMAQHESGNCFMHRLRNGTTLPLGTMSLFSKKFLSK